MPLPGVRDSDRPSSCNRHEPFADGRWKHKADRGVYANFEQIAGVPLWEKVKAPASDHHITLDNPQGFVDVVRKFLRS